MFCTLCSRPDHSGAQKPRSAAMVGTKLAGFRVAEPQTRSPLGTKYALEWSVMIDTY
jgi:hypothetical protein